MTTIGVATAPASTVDATVSEGRRARAQLLALAKRSVIGTLRQPAIFVPAVVFPLFFAALGSSSFSRATALPGFPRVRSFLDFQIAATMVQGVLFGSVQGGADLAIDIEQGFFDRLLLSPVSRTSIVLARLAGAAALGAAQITVFTLATLPFGMRISSGLAGFCVLVVAGSLIATTFGGFMAAVAIRTGSSEAVQGSFPMVFVLLFFSSAFFPRQTMTGWFKRVASLNPMSYLIEAMRSLVIEHLHTTAVLRAIGIPLAVGAVSLPLTLRALRTRVGVH